MEERKDNSLRDMSFDAYLGDCGEMVQCLSAYELRRLSLSLVELEQWWPQGCKVFIAHNHIR